MQPYVTQFYNYKYTACLLTVSHTCHACKRARLGAVNVCVCPTLSIYGICPKTLGTWCSQSMNWNTCYSQCAMYFISMFIESFWFEVWSLMWENTSSIKRLMKVKVRKHFSYTKELSSRVYIPLCLDYHVWHSFSMIVCIWRNWTITTLDNSESCILTYA